MNTLDLTWEWCCTPTTNLFWLTPKLLIVVQPRCMSSHSSKFDLQTNCAKCTKLLDSNKMICMFHFLNLVL